MKVQTLIVALTATSIAEAFVASSPKLLVNKMSSSRTSSRPIHKQLHKPQQALFMSDAAASPEEEPVKKNIQPGTATVPELCFNLIKGIVGAGVLSLPAGIAAFGTAKSAVLPALGYMALIGSISAYGFALIGRVCASTDSTSYRSAWEATMGKYSWLPAVAVTFKTFCAILAYSMILGDTFGALLSTVGVSLTKPVVTWGLTAGILLPLCLLKNLSALAPFSLVGTLGMAYTAIAMTIRYLGGAYASGGKFATQVAPQFQPSFGTVGAAGALTPAASILIGMLSTAYMAHFNAPKFYSELKEQTLSNYYKVVGTSFAAAIGIMCWISGMGFLTFGGSASGLILNNYATTDTLMSLSRIAVAVSLVFSYPLAFVGFRDGVFDMAGKKNPSTKTQNVVTTALLSFVTVAALTIPDVSFVLAFGGATLGNALIYVFPALMFRKSIQMKGDQATKGQKREVKLALTSAITGIFMGVLGAKKALQSIGVL